ncbi:hypothetical protein HQN87_19030 [Paenibacillus tritici]|uniref:Uncharacterized protein n=1 Tax=Paenibacillus tritici TaxID=1873425 RepID=A0ABX2DUC0_9BACL|nr:hypothetical protein [Paenibacillus tritici]NQX47431.1 hypothetical protein [Paenibacillus tritici]QUL55893.1 hypothetical protein KDC22_04930 [Paenibacillus tritici]
MKRRLTGVMLKLLGSSLLLLGITFTFDMPQAKANYLNDIYNGLQSFSELPGEVTKLQESYQKTAEELQQTKEDLGEAKDQLTDSLQQMQTYQAQNAALQEQNRQLSQVVDELKNDRTARENYFNRIKVTVIAGLALVLGYFLLIRLLRFTMRHRSRKSDRLR